MPLTQKGTQIFKAMKSEYGSKKGKSVFYASANKGTIQGVHKKGHGGGGGSPVKFIKREGNLETDHSAGRYA